MYGLAGPILPDEGLASMREAAALDVVEAQMALADYLQAMAPARPQDSLYWYGRAARLGDARAAGRAARLEHRIAPAAEKPAPPPDTIVDPSPLELQHLYRQGYHCHTVSGERWCHIADDL